MKRLIGYFKFLSALLFVVGCGPTAENNLFEFSQSQSPFGVAIFDIGSTSNLFVGAPEGVRNLSVCVRGSTGDCVPNQTYTGTFQQSKNGRGIFKIQENFSFQSNVAYLIRGAPSSGAEVKSGFKLIQNSSTENPQPQGPSDAVNWKVVLMASDQGNQGYWISAFDNARKKLKEIFLGKSVKPENIRELSLHPRHQSSTVKPASLSALVDSVRSLQPSGTNDACLVHMTSHGSKSGFNIGYDMLAPSELEAALKSCGESPTVVLVSACYSGLYTLDQSGLKKPNRIILTAARSDRTSFGCSPEAQYTYWDGCLIDELSRGSSSTWSQLANNIQSCISRKESGIAAPSYPQKFIGAQVKDLKLPGK